MVVTTRCLRGHESTDADFCSECGVRMASSARVNAGVTATPLPTAAGICPDCGTAQALGARYCEVCRYDHAQDATTGQAAQVASATGTATPAVATPMAISAASVSLPVTRCLYLVVGVDAHQAKEQGAAEDCPVDRPARYFPLGLASTLIGRRSQRRGVFPELDLADAGVSHQHLVLLQQKDSSFTALELGSSNGTRLNGTELQRGVSVPIKVGDELRLGIWTRITIEEK